jgi:phosphatidylinositol alpha-1,6-mannosyltransferase
VAGWENYDKKSRLKIIRLKEWGNASLHPKFIKVYASAFLKALKLTSKFKIDIIHCDTVLPAGLIGFLLAKTGRTTYAVYAHGEEIQIYKKLFPEKHVLHAIYKNAVGVIANSVYTKKQLMDLGVHSNCIHLINPGVDTEVFKPGIETGSWRHRLHLTNEKVLLSVSRLTKRKGHDQVIRAIPAIMQKFQNVVYLIAGSGSEERHLKQLSAALGLNDSVRFLGYVKEDELPSLYNLADVFIMPNREIDSGEVEGFGMVFIEANACGIPVIGGNSGGTSSAIIQDETGVLVDGTNLDDITAAIVRLLENPELSFEMGKKGRERAVREFGWDTCLEKIRAIGSS